VDEPARQPVSDGKRSLEYTAEQAHVGRLGHHLDLDRQRLTDQRHAHGRVGERSLVQDGKSRQHGELQHEPDSIGERALP